MAGLKKKKQEKSTSPNVVLVIFLVFFFLVSIGLGIWGYYGYAGQDDLVKAKRSADGLAKTEKLQKEYYSMLYRQAKLVLGETLEQSEEDLMKLDTDSFMTEGYGKFKDEKGADAARKLMLDFKDKNLPKEVKTAQDKAKEWEGKTNAIQTSISRMEEFTKRLTAKQDASNAKIADEIGKEEGKILAAAQKQSDQFKATSANNQELIQQLKDAGKLLDDTKDEHEKQMATLKRQLAKMTQERKDDAGAVGAPAMGRGESSPLVLDISMGKPLWDQPVGKVIQVDLELRQVYINIGSAHGAWPELTFVMFGANAAGKAEKQMKGSIEIVKVVDSSTSIARITSLYDAEGLEIPLNSTARGRVLRQAELPVREGDLLFNMFWGARVAVVGYVSVTGEPSDNPAEQDRQMNDFIHLLQRNGMQVDAHVDMKAGKLIGNISSKTRYLIRGDDLRAAGDAKPAAPKMDDDKDKDKDKDKDDKDKDKDKEPAKDVPVNQERNDSINRSSRALFNEAKDRGLLIMSAENFATVIGYRRPSSATNPQISSFRPSLPFAGSGQAGVVVVPDRPREEKKDAPPPEKKADN